MVKILLSLMLVSVQVLSWNAQPVYLCLETNGSECFDLGPALCDCCHSDSDHSHSEHSDSDSEHACSEEACTGSDCQGHSHSADKSSVPSTSGTVVSDPDSCGCTHRQVSAAQSATLGGRVQFDWDHAVAPLPVAVLPAVMLADQFSHRLLADSFARVDLSSAVLDERAVVVMRC